MMSGGWFCLTSLRKGVGAALVISVLATIYSCFFMSIALAGTETGEFCPTCPDWTDLDGWLAKRDAYERAQFEGQQNGIPVNNSIAKINKPPKVYPVPELLTSAASPRISLIVIDVRSPKEYEISHISGARNIYWKDLQKDGRLDPALAESVLRKAGINNSDRLLICGGSDEGAAFVFWALSYLGHGNASILDGGIDEAWSAGVKPDTLRPSVTESNYTLHIKPWLLVNEENLQKFLKLSGLQILDARDFTEYGKSRLTTSSIPLTADKLFEGSKIKDVITLEELLGRRDLNKKGTQLVYGTPQAYYLFYGLKLMGYNATLLEGSWWLKSNLTVNDVR